MLKIENTEVVGWEAVIRGIHSSMNSWEKIDSFIPCYRKTKCHECEVNQKCAYYFEDGEPYKKNEFIGPNDLNLMTRLRNAGTDRRKFMRMITVYADITAPLYWWKEFDAYKIDTVAISCPTIPKIADKEFELNNFSSEDLIDSLDDNWDIAAGLECRSTPLDILYTTIDALNIYREKYFETKDKKYWWQIIKLLPNSYNQRRTIIFNYKILVNIYKCFRNYKSNEWHTFCDWIENLPYSELIIGKEKNNDALV